MMRQCERVTLQVIALPAWLAGWVAHQSEDCVGIGRGLSNFTGLNTSLLGYKVPPLCLPDNQAAKSVSFHCMTNKES